MSTQEVLRHALNGKSDYLKGLIDEDILKREEQGLLHGPLYSALVRYFLEHLTDKVHSIFAEDSPCGLDKEERKLIILNLVAKMLVIRTNSESSQIDHIFEESIESQADLIPVELGDLLSYYQGKIKLEGENLRNICVFVYLKYFEDLFRAAYSMSLEYFEAHPSELAKISDKDQLVTVVYKQLPANKTARSGSKAEGTSLIVTKILKTILTIEDPNQISKQAITKS